MPQMDGYEASQIRLHEKEEGGKPAYIIAMTANAMQGDREKCLEAADERLPFQAGQGHGIAAALARACALRRPRKRNRRQNGKPSEATAPEVPSQEALVDLERLEAAANEDPKVLQELVELYFAQATDLMNGLHGAINSGSAKDVDHFAHKLVGASLACGMSAMVLPLRELEKRGKEGHLGRRRGSVRPGQPPSGTDTQ